MEEDLEDRSSDHLAQLLDQHRDELHRIPGVVGTAIGYRTEKEQELALLIYYHPSANPSDIRRQVASILPDEPVELQATPGLEPM